MFGRSFPVSVGILLGLLVGFAASQQPQVTVEQGALFGTTETFHEDEFINITKNIDVFKGIPFAEPPVGPLRFRAPVEKSSWGSEVYNATYFREASCIQFATPVLGIDASKTSEDCLHLNIFAPNPQVQGGVPVMVWIHGGGYTTGSAELPEYNGFALAAVGDVIVVTINYRLNIFGFLTTDDEASPGNAGLMDQAMALKWIKQNIAAFGGDSERITIFGESAGAGSVSMQMLSKMSEGLFNQAIMQSGTAIAPWSYYENKKEMRQEAFKIGDAFGCAAVDSAALVDCLRQQDAQELLAKSIEEGFRTSPVFDGVFLEDSPSNLYTSGRYNHVNILLGSNADEGSLILLLDPRLTENYTAEVAPVINREDFEDGISDQLRLLFGVTDYTFENAISSWYTDWSQADNKTADFYRAIVDIGTDLYFACNTDYVARTHAQGGDNVFLYQFTHIPSVSIFDVMVNGEFYGPGWTGAAHAEDLLFVFGTAFIPETASRRAELLDTEKAMSVKFMEFWSNFAKTGNPGLKTPGSQPASEADYWPEFTIPELRYKELNMNFGTGRALKSNECQFWNSYLPHLYTVLASIEEVELEWRESYTTWKYTDMADWQEQFDQYKAATGN